MRNWSLLFFVTLIPLNIFADIRLSSPQIKLNSQDQRVIEIKIQDGDIQDGDIFLNQYKSDDPINEADITYTLIEDFETYQTFTIVLSEEYLEDYFSFNDHGSFFAYFLFDWFTYYWLPIFLNISCITSS